MKHCLVVVVCCGTPDQMEECYSHHCYTNPAMSSSKTSYLAKRKEIKKSHYIRNLHTYTRYRNTLTTHIQNKPTSCSMLNDALALSKLGHSPCNSTHMYADRQTHKLNFVHSHMHAHKTNQIFLVLYKTVLSHKVHLYIIYSHLHVNIKFSE